MRVPSAAELLDIWEAGARVPSARRALLLVGAAYPEASEEELAALPVGRRDARLLRLYEQLFGGELTFVVPCPACGEPLESSLRTSDVRLSSDETFDSVHALRADGYEVSFRLPAGGDLLALAESSDTRSARSTLLHRCLIGARNPDGVPIESDSLPEAVIEALAARMAAADPQADVQIDLACPACDHRWQPVLDIAAFLWSELHAWAQRTLREVHALARAYGWREADVLALSPTRRQIYLELSGQ